MAKGERLTIDLGGLRERIETYQEGIAWERLPTAQKIKILLEQGMQHEDWIQFAAAIKKLMRGRRPSLADITVAAEVLEVAPEELRAFCDRILAHNPNGDPHGAAVNRK